MGGSGEGFSYARHGNPNVAALVDAMQELEEAPCGIATASGMAATDAALYACGLTPGDRVLASQDVYGASLDLLSKVWKEEAGIVTVIADLTDTERLPLLLDEVQPRVVLLETISNPLLKVLNVPLISRLAHAVNAQVIADNTFASPIVCRPMTWGADLVVHSATKYLGGHGDAMGGIVVGREVYRDRLHQYLKLRGAVLGPFEAWLIHRGLRSLAVRYERQSANAAKIARILKDSGQLCKVYYPFLPDHPTFSLASELLGNSLGGAVVTVDLRGGKETAFRFLDHLKLVASATTVGDIYTLCLYPLISSHRNISADQRAAMGITDGTIRISVGLEDPSDIVADVLAAAAFAGS
jgi:cystathionine beta-lyase/cystathionine gamma-synthase